MNNGGDACLVRDSRPSLKAKRNPYLTATARPQPDPPTPALAMVQLTSHRLTKVLQEPLVTC